MRFEFPDKDIMLIRDCNISGPKEGPEPGSRWTLVFDGASNAHGNGIGEFITSPTGCHVPFTARLCLEYTNNMAEYEACIFGIEATIDLRIKILRVYGDSGILGSKCLTIPSATKKTEVNKIVFFLNYIVYTKY